MARFGPESTTTSGGRLYSAYLYLGLGDEAAQRLGQDGTGEQFAANLPAITEWPLCVSEHGASWTGLLRWT